MLLTLGASPEEQAHFAEHLQAIGRLGPPSLNEITPQSSDFVQQPQQQ
jgi:hypothetical protein